MPGKVREWLRHIKEIKEEPMMHFHAVAHDAEFGIGEEKCMEMVGKYAAEMLKWISGVA